MSRRLLLVLAGLVCALACVPNAAFGYIDADFGNKHGYRVWAGCTSFDGNDAVTASRGFLEEEVSPGYNANTLSGQSPLSTITCGEADTNARNGIHVAAVTPDSCLLYPANMSQPQDACKPKTSGNVWKDISFSTGATNNSIYALKATWFGRTLVPHAGQAVPGLPVFQWWPELRDENDKLFQVPATNQGYNGQDTGSWAAYYVPQSESATNPDTNRCGWSWNGWDCIDKVSNCYVNRYTTKYYECAWRFPSYTRLKTADLFSSSTTTELHFKLYCAHTTTNTIYADMCPLNGEKVWTSGEYAARVTLSNLVMYLVDEQAPTVDLSSSPSTSLGTSAGSPTADGKSVYKGTALAAAAIRGTDNSSVKSLAQEIVDGSGINKWAPNAVGSRCLTDPSVRVDYPYLLSPQDDYWQAIPCERDYSAPSSSFGTFDSTKVSNGDYTFRATTTDISGLTRTETRNIIIDNPGPDPCSSASNKSTIFTPSGAVAGYTQWLNGSVQVSGQVCDKTSGVDWARIERSVNGADWTTVCTDYTDVLRNTARTFSCSFDSTPFNEGATVAFRVTYADIAGNTYSTDPSSDRYIDNTAPQATAITLDADGYYPWTAKSPQAGEWTNAENITAKWSQVLPGAGVPVSDVYLAYRPAPSTACSWTTYTLAASATSKALLGLPDGCAEASAQGAHTIYLWARDVLGNVPANPTTNSVSSRVAQQAFNWDSIAPRVGTLTATPGNWTTTNAFQAVFTAPTVAAATQSPLKLVQYQVGEGAVQTTDCREGSIAARAGATCTIGSTDPGQSPITVPGSGGQFLLRVWVRDLAGNADRQKAGSDTLKYDDRICIR